MLLRDHFGLVFRGTFFIGLFLLATSPLCAQQFTKINDSPVVADAARTLGISWVDYDGDGDLDIFASNIGAGEDIIYRNLLIESGTATFEVDSSAGDLGNQGFGSLGNTWADIDNDGDLDVYTSTVFSKLFVNNGDGTFALVTEGDIASANNISSWAAAWGDIDNDSYVDLVAVHPAGFLGPVQPNHLFLNNDGTSFTEVDSGASPITSGTAPFTVGSWSDYDRDGDIDLFIGSGPAVGFTAPDFLYENSFSQNGTAGFTPILNGIVATDARDGQVFNWIDTDNDGDLDVYITNYWGGDPNGLPNDYYLNNNGTYVKVTSGDIVTDTGFSLANTWGDYDNDGDLDVLITNDQGTLNYLYFNNGDGTFVRDDSSPMAFETAATGSYGASAGDYDNDGDLDLITGNGAFIFGGNTNFFYRNDSDNGNGWLNIDLEGSLSNRTALGAKVWAKATINGNSYWQYREVSAQNSFCGHNSFRVHFGLGDALLVDSLLISWPSGVQQSYTNVDVKQFLNIRENAPFNQFDTQAEIVFKGEARNRISAFHTFDLNDASDSFDPATEDVYVQAGGFEELIPAGSFVAISDWQGYQSGQHCSIWRYLDPRADGIRAMVIVLKNDGAGIAAFFAKRIDLQSTMALYSPENVPFRMWLGNDAGEATIVMREDGKRWTTLGVEHLAKVDGEDLFAPVDHLPANYSLKANYPNPFNPSTTIEFDLPEAAVVTLEIFDNLGRHVAGAYRDSPLRAGTHKWEWNATDARGNPLSSGIYFYRLQANGYTQIRKMMLVR